MTELVPIELIASKIYLIRDVKVILDRDLAELYEIETRVLNQAVKRNIKRFPKDFMFQLTKDEFKILKSQIVTSRWGGVPAVLKQRVLETSAERRKRACWFSGEFVRVVADPWPGSSKMNDSDTAHSA